MLKIQTKILIFLAVLFFPLSAKAATLFISPASGTYKPSDTFSVNVYAGSSDQAMNAASGVLSFSKDTLEVVSVSKAGSIFSLWIQEPSFSNSAGTVNFEGIVLNPGFTGGSGKILTVSFKAKASGSGNMSLSSGSILANDGLGTNILSGLGSARFTISSQPGTSDPKANASVSKETVSPVSPQPPSSVAVASDIVITSVTHPDQNVWYNNNSPELIWAMPKGVSEVRTLITTSTNALPTVLYAPPVSNKKIEGLSDGTYYFLIQAKTSAGWGNVARYQINIDTTPPEPFAVTFPHGNESLEPQPVILFNTTDISSGILEYEVRVGRDGIDRIAPSAVSNPYPLPPQKPGSYQVLVTAIDNAGNKTTSNASFIIETTNPPSVTSYPTEVDFEDLVRIRGNSYVNADIHLFVRHHGVVISEEESRTNSLGDFAVLITKRLHPGMYTITAEVVDSRGAKSGESEPINFEVTSQFIVEIANLLLHFPVKSLILSLIICAIFLMMISLLGRGKNRFTEERKKSKKVFVESLRSLRKDLEDHIEKLNKIKIKRRLTEEEILFLDTFQKRLKEVDMILVKEIEVEKTSV